MAYFADIFRAVGGFLKFESYGIIALVARLLECLLMMLSHIKSVLDEKEICNESISTLCLLHRLKYSVRVFGN